MIQTRRSTRRAAIGEGGTRDAAARSAYPAPFLAADAARPTQKSSMPGVGRVLVFPVMDGSIEQRRNIPLSYSEPNRLAIGHVESRDMPAIPAIVARQKAITVRGRRAPASMKDVA